MMHGTPLDLIDRIFAGLQRSATVEFSVYTYSPQTVADERTIYRVEATRIREFFLHLEQTVEKNEEVAFHSKFTLQGFPTPFHLPMMDFKGDLHDEDILHIRELLREINGYPAYLYHSGRSYHLYSSAMIPDSKWPSFMGRILLLDLPNRRQIVDTRWVGHRLMAGYGSLRWTNRSTHYLAEPKLYKILQSGRE